MFLKSKKGAFLPNMYCREMIHFIAMVDLEPWLELQPPVPTNMETNPSGKCQMKKSSIEEKKWTI